MTALYWLVAVLVFGLLIFIHEFGHYLTARLFNVKIFEFSIGMGPKMVTYTSKKTEIKYSLGILPFGGYVSMAGEEDGFDDPNALPKKPAWQRFIITFAGAFMNLVLGIILVFSLVLFGGPLGSTTVDGFRPDEFYEVNEFTDRTSNVLQVGDEIVKVNGNRVHTADDLQYEIQHEGGEEIPVTVRRGGEELTLSVKFPVVTSQGVSFGVPDFWVKPVEKTVGTVLSHTYHQSVSTVKMIWDSLIDLITGKYGLEAVSGPVGVAGAISDAASTDFTQLIYLVAVITMNLGVMNLLPIPALDGGRLLFILLEIIFRRPVLTANKEAIIHTVGIVILMLLMVVVLFKDIFTLFT